MGLGEERNSLLGKVDEPKARSRLAAFRAERLCLSGKCNDLSGCAC
jgi:hypothetical protein